MFNLCTSLLTQGNNIEKKVTVGSFISHKMTEMKRSTKKEAIEAFDEHNIWLWVWSSVTQLLLGSQEMWLCTINRSQVQNTMWNTFARIIFSNNTIPSVPACFGWLYQLDKQEQWWQNWKRWTSVKYEVRKPC